MQFEIHFTIGNYEDSFIVEGETVDDCQEASKKECEKRGITNKEHDLWSQELYKLQKDFRGEYLPDRQAGK